MISNSVRIPTDARRFYLELGSLILAAWGLLVAWQSSAYAELLGHEALENHAITPALHLAAFLLSWFLMTVAMMLPVSLRMLNVTMHPIRQRMGSKRLAGLLIPGYLSPWALFGLLIFLGDSFLHRMAEPGGPLAPFSPMIGPAMVLVAGLYQITPFKSSLLRHCQPSHAFFQYSDRMKMSGAGVLRQGILLGFTCLGSCWSLMLLMFALGQHRPDRMLVLGLMMAAERHTPWGHRLSRLIGLGLIVWAIVWLFASLYPLV